MNNELLKKAIAIANITGQVFIATADPAGTPHIACAGKAFIEKDNHLSVTEWFCPGTVANVQENKNISVVVWDKKSDTGFQVLGQVETIQDVGMMDGYAPAVEKRHPMPQVERRLVIKVDKILDFKLGPHTDMEE
jgi:hypothetical protein